jgi:uncharacterized protein YdeI (YjbR/CyaY-like superfamily)
MEFSDNNQFVTWIAKNANSHDGIWIRFIKDKRKKIFTAEEALDIALCYGWIDGVMKSEGDSSYIKYFAPRTDKSKWSEKNKKSIERLRKNKQMTKYGEEAVKKAIENGQWSKEKVAINFDKLILDLSNLLSEDKNIFARFNECSLSIKKRFCGFYFDAKTEGTRIKRLEKIKQALITNNTKMLF